MTLLVTQMNRPEVALAAAAHFLARRAPFDRYPFGAMTLSLDHQARSKTYLFALEGQKVVGYVGWVMLDAARARAFARDGRVPGPGDTGGDDVLWILVAGADSRQALEAMLAAGRQRYAGKRVMGVRHKPGGRKVVFDQLIRLRTTRPS